MVSAMRSRRFGSRSVSCTDGSLAFSRSIRLSTSADMLLAPLVVDRVIGPGDEPDRGDLAAAAAGAVSAGGGVIVVAIEHQALGVAVRLDRAFDEAGRRVRRAAQEVEPRLQRLEQRRVLLALDERMRSADVDAFEAAGAFPRIDGGGEEAAASGGRRSPSRRRTAASWRPGTRSEPWPACRGRRAARGCRCRVRPPPPPRSHGTASAPSRADRFRAPRRLSAWTSPRNASR